MVWGCLQKFSPAHLRSLNHDSETHGGIEYSPPCPSVTRWYPLHRLHLSTNPWHLAQIIISSPLPQGQMVGSDAPQACSHGSGPALSSGGGGGRLAAHTNLHKGVVRRRSRRRLRAARLFGRLIPSIPYITRPAAVCRACRYSSSSANIRSMPPRRDTARCMMCHTSPPVGTSPLHRYIPAAITDA